VLSEGELGGKKGVKVRPVGMVKHRARNCRKRKKKGNAKGLSVPEGEAGRGGQRLRKVQFKKKKKKSLTDQSVQGHG